MFAHFFSILQTAANTIDGHWNQYCDTLLIDLHYNSVDGRVYVYVDQQRFTISSFAPAAI